MSCKGVCDRYKAIKPVGIGRYAAGQKRCQVCEIFINFNGNNCPCCNYKLRAKPRNIKYKAMLADSIKSRENNIINLKEVSNVSN